MTDAERLGPGLQYYSTSPRTVRFRYDPETLKVLEVEGNAKAFLGFACDDWLADDFLETHAHPYDARQAMEFCRAAAEAGSPHELVYRWINAEGQTLWIHVVVSAPKVGQAGWEASAVDVSAQVLRLAQAEAVYLDQLRELAAKMTRELSELSRSGDLLARHLAAQRDDVGSDHAVNLRSGLQRLTVLLDAQAANAPEIATAVGLDREAAKKLMKRLSKDD